MKLHDCAKFWNTTVEEHAASYPCDRYLDVPSEGLIRAIDVEAPPEVAFRWVCQLKVAPYSYDWLDNGGRQSPRQLTPGADQLKRGQHFLIFELVDFEVNRHITGVARSTVEHVYGQLAGSYVVRPRNEHSCRLVVKLNVGASSRLERIRRVLLAWSDLFMMRKQLLTLKKLAERHAAAQIVGKTARTNNNRMDKSEDM